MYQQDRINLWFTMKQLSLAALAQLLYLFNNQPIPASLTQYSRSFSLEQNFFGLVLVNDTLQWYE